MFTKNGFFFKIWLDNDNTIMCFILQLSLLVFHRPYAFKYLNMLLESNKNWTKERRKQNISLPLEKKKQTHTTNCLSGLKWSSIKKNCDLFYQQITDEFIQASLKTLLLFLECLNKNEIRMLLAKIQVRF